MILEAIKALNEDNGSNKSSISKYIESTYGGLPQGHKVLLNVHHAKMRDSGVLVFWKNNYTKHDLNVSPRRGRGRPPKLKEPLPPGTVLSLPKPRGSPPKDSNGSPKPPKALTESGRSKGQPRKMSWPIGGLGEALPASKVKVATNGRPRGRPPKVKPMFIEISA